MILAAGTASRFGSDKMLARLDGRPMLQHVLDTAASSHPACSVAVVGTDDAPYGELDWGLTMRVRNPDSALGMSSSLRIGLEASAGCSGLHGVLIMLGDQPRTTLATLQALVLATPAAIDADAIAVLPAYSGGGGANPALLLRAGFGLVSRLCGDRGLGGLFRTLPDRVRWVSLPGSNPDVDTPAELRAIARGDRESSG